MLLAPQDHRTWGSGLVVEKQKCGCVNKHIYPGTPEFGVAFKASRCILRWDPHQGGSSQHFLHEPTWILLLCCSQAQLGDPGGSGWEISVVPAFPAALDSNPLWILTSSGLRCFLCLHLSTVLAWLGGGQWIFSSGEKQRAEVGWMWCLVMVKGKQNEESPLAGEGKQELGNILSWEGWSRPQNPTLRALPKYSQTQLPPVPSPGSYSFFLVNICTNLSNPDH